MLAALVCGDRDPQVLAELAKGKLRKQLPQLRQALQGRFGEQHGLLIGLALDHQGGTWRPRSPAWTPAWTR
jgi:transposase